MVRAWLLPILLGLTAANAHIVFSVPELSCDATQTGVGCLRGQVCSDSGKCGVASKYATNSHDEALEDCDPELCDPPAKHPKKRGQNSAEGANVIPRPVINRAPPPGKVTTNGTCGVDYGNTVCGNWDRGSCCSPYGWCGNTTGHCGFGCQSGPCLDDEIVKPIGPMANPPPGIPGVFEVVGQSGVPVMTAILMQNGKVIFLDKVENYTQILLSNGQYAYSAEYDPATNNVVGLSVKTNPFCCGGAFLADGRVISVGGNGPLPHVDSTVGDGFKGIRYLERGLENHFLDGEPWEEPGHQLSTPRWYPTVQILPDGRLFVVSGSVNGLDPTVASNNNPTYEILDRNGFPQGESYQMQILVKNQPYYMYPFIHLLRDGSMFVFVSKSAEIFDVDSGATIRTLPDLRGDYRTYPNTGGSVLLPLRSSNGWEPEVMVCGGGAYQDRTSPTDPSCGRIRPLADDPQWELDAMPKGRGMVEGILLLDGTTLWINGCSRGAQGYGLGTDPVYDAWIYNPNAPLGERWATAGTTPIARLYHSAALLLLDGRVMVAGSNPVEQPILVPNPSNPMEEYVTEFRVEIYTPSYLLGGKENRRPRDVWVEDKYVVADGNGFMLYFTCEPGSHDLQVILYHGGFVTHSLHMNHRMIYLDTDGWAPDDPEQEVWVSMPPDSNVAPPGPYVLYVVVDGVPSVGQFLMVEYPGQPAFTMD